MWTVECDLLDKMSYDDVIDTFSAAKSSNCPNRVSDLFSDILKSIKNLLKIFDMGLPRA